jgi:hypothetical protein
MRIYDRLPYVAALLGLLITSSLGSSLGAQSNADVRNVELAAVEYIRDKLPKGAVKFDPVHIPAGLAHPDPPAAGMRGSEGNALLAARLGADIAPHSEVIVCSDTTRSCQMKGAASYVRMSIAEITGTQAKITVTIITGPRWYETLELALAREGNQWKVLKERQLGIS